MLLELVLLSSTTPSSPFFSFFPTLETPLELFFSPGWILHDVLLSYSFSSLSFLCFSSPLCVLQFLASLSSFPPLAVSLSTLVPIVVSSRDGHDSILHLFKRQLQASLSSSTPSAAVSSSPYLHPPSPHERGFLLSEKEEKDLLFSFGNLDPLLRYHMLYFHPLSRRFLPEDFVNFLSYTKMKCSLLYSTEIKSRGGEQGEGERKTFAAVCVAQYLPHPTVLPKLYQQFYNHFLQLG